MSAAKIVLLFMLACSSTTRSTVSAGIDEFAKARNYEKLGPSARSISSAVTGGVLDALTGPEREKAIAKLVDELVDTTMKSLGENIDTTLGPAIQRQVRASVRGVIDEALAAPTRDGAAALTTRLMDAAFAAIGAGIREEVGPAIASAIDQVGPALRRTIESELAPAIANALKTITPALGDTVEAVTNRATLGAIRAVDTLGPAFDKRVEQLKQVMSDGRREVVSTVSAIAIGGLALLLGVAVVLLIWRNVTAKRREDALQLVTLQIKSMEGNPAIQRLTAQIKASGNARPGGPALSAYLSRHNLKVTRTSQASPQPHA